LPSIFNLTTLATWRLDRLGRTMKHLIELMGELERQGIPKFFSALDRCAAEDGRLLDFLEAGHGSEEQEAAEQAGTVIPRELQLLGVHRDAPDAQAAGSEPSPWSHGRSLQPAGRFGPRVRRQRLGRVRREFHCRPQQGRHKRHERQGAGANRRQFVPRGRCRVESGLTWGRLNDFEKRHRVRDISRSPDRRSATAYCPPHSHHYQ
jgi:hypothetical protein